MRAITEDDLQNMLSSGQRKALDSFRKRLASENDDVIFDDKALEVIKEYAWDRHMIEDVRGYLNGLRDEQGKLFSRSCKQYSSMVSVWEQFVGPERDSFLWNRNCRRALEKVKERYSRAKIRPLVYKSTDDIKDHLSDLTTSSGWEAILSGAKHKGDIFDKYDVFETFKTKADQAIIDGSFNQLMVPGVRTQCSGEFAEDGSETGTCKHKTRPIWMVSVWVIIAETIFGDPINDWMKTYSYSNIGKSSTWTSNWIFRMRGKYGHFMSVDYSKYDSTIPSWLIHAAFDVIRSMFVELTEYQSKLLRVIENDFIHKNLVTADGILHVDHGNPSGSKLTAIVNGICNEIITETWVTAFKRKAEYNIMGDDNLIYLDLHVDADEVRAYIYKNFGISVNQDKTNCSISLDNPEYLSRVWTVDGPDRHEKILLSKLMFPERFRKYGQDVTPELVVYSYLLGYPPAIRRLIDVDRFLVDTGLCVNKLKEVEEAIKHLPYNVREALYSTPEYKERIGNAA